MPWLILHIESDEDHCEAIEDALLGSGASAVTLQDTNRCLNPTRGPRRCGETC